MTREEAINLVKQVLPCLNIDKKIRESFETLVPELHESEDEIIRKWLIEMVEELRKANPTNAEHNGNCSEAIAYLERQKEQIVIKQNIIDSIRANTQPDWDFSTIPNLHKEISRFFGEKFILPHTEDTIITVSDVIRCAYHFYKFGQQEQKPAEWSEEDKKMLAEVIDSLSDYENSILYNSSSTIVEYLEKEISWFKSLPERFNLQPNWKPSEEQMEWLESAVKLSTDKPHIHGIIVSLYEQLKRLWSLKAKDIIVGKRVIYYPILGSYKNGIEAIITHGVQEICGTKCCWIDAISSCVDIEHLVSAE